MADESKYLADCKTVLFNDPNSRVTVFLLINIKLQPSDPDHALCAVSMFQPFQAHELQG